MLIARFGVGGALLKSGEVPQIAAGSKHRGDTWYFGGGVGALQALECFDHEDEHDVVVGSRAIAARHTAPPATDPSYRKRLAGRRRRTVS